MRVPRTVPVIALVLVWALASAADDRIAPVKRLPASKLDSALPQIPLETWIANLSGVPKPKISWEVNDCGEGGDGRAAPTCVEASFALRDGKSASVSLAITDVQGKSVEPSTWYAVIGAGDSFKSYRSLAEWSKRVRESR